MNRDGAFKVRTDLLSDKIGKTDDWLTAINLNTSIPKKINPLELLPLKIPLRIFVDIGTYAEAWKKEFRNRTLSVRCRTAIIIAEKHCEYLLPDFVQQSI